MFMLYVQCDLDPTDAQPTEHGPFDTYVDLVNYIWNFADDLTVYTFRIDHPVWEN